MSKETCRKKSLLGLLSQDNPISDAGDSLTSAMNKLQGFGLKRKRDVSSDTEVDDKYYEREWRKKYNVGSATVIL